MEDNPTRKNLRPLIIGVLVFLLIAAPIVGYVLFRMHLSAGIEARIQAIRDAGHPATLDELADWAPPIPAAENAALVYTRAFAALPARGDSAFTELEEKVPVVSQLTLPPVGEPWPDNMQRNTAAYLKACDQTLQLLHQAGAIKRSRYNLNYSAGFGMLLPHLARCRHAARLLKLQATLAAEQGDTARSTQALTSLLGIARSLRTEPLLISQLVRMAVRSITTDTLARALSRTQFSNAQLSQLQQAFDHELDNQMMVRAFVGERCSGIAIFHDLRTGKVNPAQAFGSQLPAAANLLVMTGLLDRDMRAYMDLMAMHVRASAQPLQQRADTAAEVETQIRQLDKRCFFTRMLVPALSRAGSEGAKSDARIHMARAALAVERYRLKHRQLPANLDQLVPQFIPAVPPDPFDGKPLRYKPADKGYLLYSVGDNLTDDGGVEYSDDNGRKRGQRLDELLKITR